MNHTSSKNDDASAPGALRIGGILVELIMGPSPRLLLCNTHILAPGSLALRVASVPHPSTVLRLTFRPAPLVVVVA